MTEEPATLSTTTSSEEQTQKSSLREIHPFAFWPFQITEMWQVGPDSDPKVRNIPRPYKARKSRSPPIQINIEVLIIQTATRVVDPYPVG